MIDLSSFITTAVVAPVYPVTLSSAQLALKKILSNFDEAKLSLSAKAPGSEVKELTLGWDEKNRYTLRKETDHEQKPFFTVHRFDSGSQTSQPLSVTQDLPEINQVIELVQKINTANKEFSGTPEEFRQEPMFRDCSALQAPSTKQKTEDFLGLFCDDKARVLKNVEQTKVASVPNPEAKRSALECLSSLKRSRPDLMSWIQGLAPNEINVQQNEIKGVGQATYIHAHKGADYLTVNSEPLLTGEPSVRVVHNGIVVELEPVELASLLKKANISL